MSLSHNCGRLGLNVALALALEGLRRSHDIATGSGSIERGPWRFRKCGSDGNGSL